jgi:hypothetical protein
VKAGEISARSRTTRSAPATSAAANRPSRRPRATAQTSTGVACQVMGTVGAPRWNAAQPTTGLLARTNSTELTRSAVHIGIRRHRGRAYAHRVTTVHAAIRPSMTHADVRCV